MELTKDLDHIIFYDGTCGLCHRAIQWLAPAISLGNIGIAPIQGKTAETIAIKRLWEHQCQTALPDAILVYDCQAEKLSAKTAAILAISPHMSGWKALLLRLVRLVPRPVADWAYDIIAKRRYQWFGRKSEACLILRPNAHLVILR